MCWLAADGLGALKAVEFATPARCLDHAVSDQSAKRTLCELKRDLRVSNLCIKTERQVGFGLNFDSVEIRVGVTSICDSEFVCRLEHQRNTSGEAVTATEERAIDLAEQLGRARAMAGAGAQCSNNE